jgi:hypothetical protein
VVAVFACVAATGCGGAVGAPSSSVAVTSTANSTLVAGQPSAVPPGATIAVISEPGRETRVPSMSAVPTSVPEAAPQPGTSSIAPLASSPAPSILDAAPGHCNGTIGPIAVSDVVVPAGAMCMLNGTIVDGNVFVGVGATLPATAVSVDGDIEAEGAAPVGVTGGSFIGADLQLRDGGAATVSDSTVDGDIEWAGHSRPVRVEGNKVSGNLQVDSNTRGVTISANSIDGDLECEDNQPAPAGGENMVGGEADAQCASM